MATVWNSLPDAPDFLRRFVAAPFEADWVIAETPVHIETNHPEILRAFLPFVRGEHAPAGTPYSLKAIVDPAIAPGSKHNAIEIDDGQLALGNFRSMFFALDRENQELVLFMQQFVAPDFSELIFRLLSSQKLRALYQTAS
jgi:hypothetical protein